MEEKDFEHIEKMISAVVDARLGKQEERFDAKLGQLSVDFDTKLMKVKADIGQKTNEDFKHHVGIRHSGAGPF